MNVCRLRWKRARSTGPAPVPGLVSGFGIQGLGFSLRAVKIWDSGWQLVAQACDYTRMLQVGDTPLALFAMLVVCNHS